jgi:hypothetical protein
MTVAVGYVLDQDSDLKYVYTVQGNRTNKNLRDVADELGI